MNVVRNHFKPEFLNRIDEIVVFHRLDEAHIERIVEHPGGAAAGSGWPSATSGLELSDAALAHIAHVGYDPDFGARPLKRVIQREVSDPVALALLKGEFHDGDIVVVDASPDGEPDLQQSASSHPLIAIRTSRRFTCVCDGELEMFGEGGRLTLSST